MRYKGVPCATGIGVKAHNCTAHCERVLDHRMRGIRSRFVQVDEIWTYCDIKGKRLRQEHHPVAVADQYVFVVMDAKTNLISSFLVGKRNAANCYYFMQDLWERVVGRVQLTTDGFRPYINAVEDSFDSNVDYPMLAKTYQHTAERETR